MSAPAGDGPIGHVSDTARWVAWYRVMESERPDALFRDPFARRLAGERGERITRQMRRGPQSAWPMIVRTAIMDEIILDLVGRGAVDLVVNLAAGLDARPWRLDLPASLRWVDVDFPDILRYKLDTIGDAPARCRYEAEAADLRDHDARRALFARLAAGGHTALVVSEGLLIYLEREQVADLARDLRATRGVRWWLLDLATPRLLKMMKRAWGKAVERGNAPFQFAPPEGLAFFEPLGWRERAVRRMLVEARRLNRLPRAWMFRFAMAITPRRKRDEIERMTSFVLLERDDAPAGG